MRHRPPPAYLRANRVRSPEQDVECENISLFITVVLTIPLDLVAIALARGDTLHRVYALMVAVSTVGYIVLGVIRHLTVLPPPDPPRVKKQDA